MQQQLAKKGQLDPSHTSGGKENPHKPQVYSMGDGIDGHLSDLVSLAGPSGMKKSCSFLVFRTCLGGGW
jgi:hypothetical protein